LEFSNVLQGDPVSKLGERDLPANALIRLLPANDREDAVRACEPVELTVGEWVSKPGEHIRHVYFPVDSYISLITPEGMSESLEVGMVGDEGMFGITLLLDVKASPLTGLVQGSGRALRMSAARFVRLAKNSLPFRHTLNRYLYVLTAQLAQSAACNRFHQLDARMARWLLMTHDRAHSNTFRLTHQFLAYMLGVRRAGVTEASGRLQAKCLIRHRHGELTVLDRVGLEATSCPCYGGFKDLYREHLGSAPRRRAQGLRKTVEA
jgi:CRP-like cAMP-binding protein